MRTTLGWLCALLLAVPLSLGVPGPASAGPASARPGALVAADGVDGADLHLVTLSGPGTAPLPPAERAARAAALVQRQDAVLAGVDAPAPVYRWTTALNGFAVELTAAQATDLRSRSGVVAVERNAVRRVAGVPGGSGAPGSPVPGSRGGEDVVVGVVDSGLWPDSPLFAPLPGAARAPGFRGTCTPGEDWPASRCGSKVVGARWFVAGFGVDRLRSASRLSAQDDSGHGTQVASVVAGNAGVGAEAGGEDLGRYGGVAPQARIAVYKACWSAPDPVDDGCATADLVTAIDRATADGVDVLTLSVGGPPGPDTVERALLGAAEADVVVVAAAGNTGPDGAAAHSSPWVTTVGSTQRPLRRGAVELRAPDGPGPALTGAMVARRTVGPVPLVLGTDAAAPGSPQRAAARCSPGSLDAARVAGAVVVCERGGLGRVEKSAAVERAEGVGMVLTSPRRAPLTADLHDVPTVHLARGESVELRRWLSRHPAARVTLAPRDEPIARRRLAVDSPTGARSGPSVKPDLVAPGTGLLGAVPPSVRSQRWDFFSGTSASAATVAGTAAVLRARHPRWPAARVRSALTTSAAPLSTGTPVARQGAGLLRPRAAYRPGLVLDVDPSAWRRSLDGGLPAARLNTASLRVTGPGTWTRRVTHTGSRARYFSSVARGFERVEVRVRPAALRLDPGEEAEFTVTVSGPPGAVDDGYVVWRGATGTRVRLPVVVGR